MYMMAMGAAGIGPRSWSAAPRYNDFDIIPAPLSPLAYTNAVTTHSARSRGLYIDQVDTSS